MKYRMFLRTVSTLFFILAVFPILLWVFLQANAFIPIIIYFQLIVIWAQAEISLRQSDLITGQYESTFEAKLSASIRPDPDEQVIILHNRSDNPAYDIYLEKIIDETGKTIPREKWPKDVRTIPIQGIGPKQEVPIIFFKNMNFMKNKTLEVVYHNRFVKQRGVSIYFLEGGNIFLLPEKKSHHQASSSDYSKTS
ncbi:MAG: hypothetical protein ACTSP1_15330 [Candidatus Freyarchaeota archaeon]